MSTIQRKFGGTKAVVIRKMIEAELPNKAIADKIGCTVDYVRAVANRSRNVARYGRAQSPIEYARAQALRADKRATMTGGAK